MPNYNIELNLSFILSLLVHFLLLENCYRLVLAPSVEMNIKPISLYALAFMLVYEPSQAFWGALVVVTGYVVGDAWQDNRISFRDLLRALKDNISLIAVLLIYPLKLLIGGHLLCLFITCSILMVSSVILERVTKLNLIDLTVQIFSYTIVAGLAVMATVALKNFLWLFGLTWWLLKTESERLRASYDEVINVISALVSALELRDVYTYQHSFRVSHFAKVLAQEIGMDSNLIDKIVIAGKIHDLGKLLVPHKILNKSTRLTEEEFEEIKKHVIYTSQLLKEIEPYFKTELEFALAHHEKWDGSGYPRGLKGEDIPIGGRILAIADTFDALITDRPYKRGVSVKKALSILENLAGKEFDPELVRAFIRAIKKEEVVKVIKEYRVRLREYQLKMLKMLEGAFDTIRLLALKDVGLMGDLFPQRGLLFDHKRELRTKQRYKLQRRPRRRTAGEQSTSSREGRVYESREDI